ncbi:hypothetical protein SAMN04489761_3384 [Tenacibaculum sp. MAR_2009_124]|uniref:hypothetical protein n=1 Tax=Tenacibaculum sp. MAR_2009_124 TaxID=1250059 RepID=UPI000896F309|nr:hypothetical protein [Tenacibaculum sp. MAR_2009_124]SEC64559.1 hypothetical protein SAMN04489761_3384 [Tenacibaculum sp. MAR_2009_124]
MKKVLNSIDQFAGESKTISKEAMKNVAGGRHAIESSVIRKSSTGSSGGGDTDCRDVHSGDIGGFGTITVSH